MFVLVLAKIKLLADFIYNRKCVDSSKNLGDS